MSDNEKEKCYDHYIDRRLLIRLVEQRPVIWDKYLEVYKDKVAKQLAWKEIYQVFMDNYDQMERKERQIFGKCVTKRWTQIRDAWLKSLKVNKRIRKFDSDSSPVRPYKYDKEMKFLRKVLDNDCLFMRSNKEDDSTLDHNSSELTEENLKEEGVSVPSIECDKVEYNHQNASSNQNGTRPNLFLRKRQYTSEINLNGKENERHMTFFKSLLPSLEMFDDDQTLEFQSGVIQLIRTIKKRPTYDDWSQESNFAHSYQTQEDFARPDLADSPSAASVSSQSLNSDSKLDLNINTNI